MRNKTILNKIQNNAFIEVYTNYDPVIAYIGKRPVSIEYINQLLKSGYLASAERSSFGILYFFNDVKFSNHGL